MAKSKGDKKAAKKKDSAKEVKGNPKRPKNQADEPKVKKGKGKGKGKAQVKSSEAMAAALAAPEVYDTPVDVEPVKKQLHPEQPISEVLRVGREFVLADFDPSSTPGFDGGRKAGKKALAAFAPEIGEWQERLFAETKGGGRRSLLIVLQGLDSAGKGGIVRHVMSNADPAGIKATAFKAPTEEERQHDFLWRIRKALPGPGQIGVFDRSHYEDVLVAKVRKLVPAAEVTKRYAIINAFEREVIESGTQLVKVFMYISRDEQRDRLMERLEREDKRFKYTPGDTDNRAFWDDYMKAFQMMLGRTSTRIAPWHVIPANNKWYARYAVQQLILDKLREMSPDWPVPDYDIEAEKARLKDS
ncbi:MAG: polyphosphate kinase 2 family protein [Actinomycetales bacterium]|nr:polyphosphate kinase 2 family protein [Actinomycetales bacterium]